MAKQKATHKATPKVESPETPKTSPSQEGTVPAYRNPKYAETLANGSVIYNFR